jgi:hypothetical protein
MCNCTTSSVCKRVRRSVESALARPKVKAFVKASMKWKDLGLEVRPSGPTDAGMGVFTSVDITRRKRVVMCLGTLVAADDQAISCWAMTWHCKRTDDKLQTAMCMKSSDHVTRYINTSDKPNCTLEWIAGKRVPVVVSLRHIPAGSELTIGNEFLYSNV